VEKKTGELRLLLEFLVPRAFSNSVGQRPTKTEIPPTARPEGAGAKGKNLTNKKIEVNLQN
jgi:hypothetical protein